MDVYLRKVSKRDFKKPKPLFLKKKKPKPVKIEALETEELEKADMEIGKKSFFSTILDHLFGSRAESVTMEEFDKIKDEPIPEPEPEEEIEEDDEDFEEFYGVKNKKLNLRKMNQK